MSNDEQQPKLALTRLGANPLTSHSERPQPQEVLEHIKWNLAVLDEELAPHLKRRLELVQQIAILEELVHPIRRIPTDIHQEIFLLCLPDEHFPTVTPSEAPLLLTQVCREWRQLALATSQLWTSVHLPVLAGDYQLEAGAISLAHSWFEAARGTPMDVSLWSASNYRADRSPITACIASHSFHIRSLKLTGSAGLLAHFQSFRTAQADAAVTFQGNVDLVDSGASLTADWPVLEELTIRLIKVHPGSNPPTRVSNTSSNPGKQISRAHFWSAPQLKSVVLSSIDEHLFSLPLKWHQLETVEVSGKSFWAGSRQDEINPSFFTHGEARKMLQKCPKISKLRATLSDHPDKSSPGSGTAMAFPQAASSSPLTHDHLVDLHLEDIVVDPHLQAGTLLHNLQLPALKTLEYFLAPSTRIASLLPTTVDYPLYRFLGSQTGPIGITSLAVSLRSIAASALIECLKLVPLLKELRLGIAGPDLKLEPEASCDVAFLNMLLPLEMRFKAVEETGTTSSPQPPHLDLPEAGLCPLLHLLNVDVARFTTEDILRFVNCRIALNQAQPTRYSRMRRFYALFMGEYRPDFVARDARGATSPIEEMLWDLGVEGTLILRMPWGCYGKMPERVTQPGWKAGVPSAHPSTRWESNYFYFGAGPFA